MEILSKQWLQKKQQHGAFRLTLTFHEKLCLGVITQNKKHPSKQVVPTIYTLEKRVFAAVTFKGLWVVSFQTR